MTDGKVAFDRRKRPQRNKNRILVDRLGRSTTHGVELPLFVFCFEKIENIGGNYEKSSNYHRQ